MKILLALSLVAGLCSGCIIVPRHHGYRPGPGYHPAAAVVRPTCPPAHHWDGYVCRHNGHGRR